MNKRIYRFQIAAPTKGLKGLWGKAHYEDYDYFMMKMRLIDLSRIENTIYMNVEHQLTVI